MDITDSTITTSTGGRADNRERLRLLLAVVWIGLPAWCVWKWIGLSFQLFGETMTLAEEAEAARWLTVAAVTAVLAPVLALLLGGRRRWVVALVLSTLFAGVLTMAIFELKGTEQIGGGLCREAGGDVRDCN